ncbi:MAG: polyphosphate kinase 1 [Intestinibacillus sp.]
MSALCEDDISYTQNRELSWLRFNQRVLEEAQDPEVPLYERLKFVSIFESNLDEFFMIRVGSLTDIALMKEEHVDNKSGWTAERQLSEIFRAVAPLYKKRDKTFSEVETALRGFGVARCRPGDLSGADKKFLDKYFAHYVLPVLSPQIIDMHHPFPHLANNVLHVMLRIKSGGRAALGIIPAPQALPPMIFLEGAGVRYVLTEELLLAYAGQVFEKCEIEHAAIIAVTRNADISPEDEAFDVDGDYLTHMKKVLKKRARLAPVRLEIQGDLPDELIEELCGRLRIGHAQVYHSRAPLKMGYVFSLADKLPEGFKITYPDFSPQPSPMVRRTEPVIPQILRHDILLHYPYESMEPFLRLLREAADDPAVVSIKITIYRLASTSKLIGYLTEAAENGKDVTALMELRARFDEENNMGWAERLEEAGCTVTYGIEGFKVHSKICLITRQTGGGIQYITQIGTGNYNEKTAKQYTDLSLMTADPGIGADAAAFFKNMLIGNLEGEYSRLLVAPVGLKKGILSLIDGEIAKAREGGEGDIFFKLNSLTDRDILTKLSEASCAGVRIRLLVRGICCLLPGVPGKTENIEVHSVVGRYLEHARVYCFGKGSERQFYIGSADLMTRNTEKRVEIASPVYNMGIQQRLVDILETQWHDNIKARILQPDGRLKKPEGAAYTPVDCQQFFIDEAIKNAAHPMWEPEQKDENTAGSGGFWQKLRALFRN